jgi:hypothetical protein
MAKVLFSGIAGVDIRNKLNGSVFSKNRAGAYIRTKVTPVNPQTDAQQAARNRLSTNSQAWRGLTETQRQGWIDAAINFPYTDIYGQTKTLSGQQLYVKLNSNLNLVGEAAIANAPTPIAIPAIETLSVDADTTPTFGVTFTPTPIPEGCALAVFATGNVTPGKTFVKNLFRFIGFVSAAATSPANLLTAYQAVHGNPVDGNKIFIRAFIISTDTGQAGIPLQSMVIVNT